MLRTNKGVKANHEESLLDPVFQTFLPEPNKMNKPVPNRGKSFVYTFLVCIILSLSALAVTGDKPSAYKAIVSDQAIEMSDSRQRSNKMRFKSSSFSQSSPAQSPGKTLESETTLGSTVLDALRQGQEGKNDEASQMAQMLVHKGTIGLAFPPESKSVGTVDDIATKIETIAREDGKGYTESRSSRSYSRKRHVHMTVRVASAEFGPIMAKLQALAAELGGTVENLETQSTDVTDEYVDSTARADTLAAARKAMEGILSRADKVKDVLEIQRELNSLMQQEESLRKRALQLKGISDMSTISLTLSQTVVGDSGEESQQWHPTTAMGLAVEHVSVLVRFIVDTMSYAMVWLLPMMVLLILFRMCKLCTKG